MSVWRKLVLVLVVLGLAVSVSACGRKGALERPPADKDRQQYPTH